MSIQSSPAPGHRPTDRWGLLVQTKLLDQNRWFHYPWLWHGPGRQKGHKSDTTWPSLPWSQWLPDLSQSSVVLHCRAKSEHKKCIPEVWCLCNEFRKTMRSWAAEKVPSLGNSGESATKNQVDLWNTSYKHQYLGIITEFVLAIQSVQLNIGYSSIKSFPCL